MKGGAVIEYFRTDEQTRSLVKLETERAGCWIALFAPTAAEIDQIARRFSIDEADLRAPLDLEEVSRVEVADTYTMFIVDTPVRSGAPESHGFETIPIAVFETPHHVISVCSRYHIPIISLLKAQRGLYDTGMIKEFTSDLLMASSTAYFNALRELNRCRTEVSSSSERPSRKDLEELYALDASFVYFTTSLATNDAAFERYRRYVLVGSSKEVKDLFDDVALENRQALETTRIYSDILDSAIDHFGLMMDYDLNRTMQLVATLTLVLCVPTVIGGLFGMNLGGIPLADAPYGFALVTSITALVLVALLVLLKRLRWF